MRRVALLASGQIEGDGMAATATLPLPLVACNLARSIPGVAEPCAGESGGLRL